MCTYNSRKVKVTEKDTNCKGDKDLQLWWLKRTKSDVHCQKSDLQLSMSKIYRNAGEELHSIGDLIGEREQITRRECVLVGYKAFSFHFWLPRWIRLRLEEERKFILLNKRISETKTLS